MSTCITLLLILCTTTELPTPEELLAKATEALGGEAIASSNIEATWSLAKAKPDTTEEISVKVSLQSYEFKVTRGKGNLSLYHTTDFDWMQLPAHTNIPAVRITRDRLYQWDPIAQPHLELLCAWERRPERRTLGLIMRGDEACYRVRLAGTTDETRIPNGAEFMYLSVVTGLPVAHESAANMRTGSRRITEFVDWESVGEIKMPKKLILTAMNEKIRTATRTTAAVLEVPLVIEVPQRVKDAKNPNHVFAPDGPSILGGAQETAKPPQPNSEPEVAPVKDSATQDDSSNNS